MTTSLYWIVMTSCVLAKETTRAMLKEMHDVGVTLGIGTD